MTSTTTITSPNKELEALRKIDEHGVEYWTARELMEVLGYTKWQNFEEVVKKAQIACMESGQDVHNHFTDVSKMVIIGSSIVRRVKDWNIDRYACYLIAQNGDPKKPQIAQPQTYFAIQTRKQEVFEQLAKDGKRIFIRHEVTQHNKKLFQTAKNAGVNQFGKFNDAGYKGLYGISLSDIERKKGIKKGELLDRAGATELAANLFRITQTDEKIRKGYVRGNIQVSQVHNMIGGKVRQTIKDIGGTLPEHLPSEKHIKKIEREQKKLSQTIEIQKQGE